LHGEDEEISIVFIASEVRPRRPHPPACDLTVCSCCTRVPGSQCTRIPVHTRHLFAPSLHRTDMLQDPYADEDDEEPPLEEDEEVGAFQLNLTDCS